jgi:hypothetical protein
VYIIQWTHFNFRVGGSIQAKTRWHRLAPQRNAIHGTILQSLCCRSIDDCIYCTGKCFSFCIVCKCVILLEGKNRRPRHICSPLFIMASSSLDEVKQLVLGYSDVHPFSKVNITDRTSVQKLLKTLLDPLKPHFSPQKARVRVPGGTAVRFDNTAAEIEGICRPMWALGSLLAGGGTYHGTEWWIQGVKSGTDPENPEYWGDPRDNDQRMVEMCPLGFTLAVAPVFWGSLSEKERGNVEAWLGNSINAKK